jgi:glycosyltransferase involved in cell wall biosynthesis
MALLEDKISIVIPFYNCRYVDQALQSAIAQTYANVEIIVVDDGSSSFKERILPYRARVRYVEKDNGGTASALNAGIDVATGKYFAWLSSDDLYRPERLAKQLAFMNRRRAVVSFANYDYIDARGKVLGRDVGVRLNDTAALCRYFISGCPVNGCTVLVRSDIFERVGLFDQTLRFTHDYDLWVRIVLAGYEFPFMAESLVMYRVHNEMTSKVCESLVAAESEMAIRRHQGRLTAFVDAMDGAR